MEDYTEFRETIQSQFQKDSFICYYVLNSKRYNIEQESEFQQLKNLVCNNESQFQTFEIIVEDQIPQQNHLEFSIPTPTNMFDIFKNNNQEDLPFSMTESIPKTPVLFDTNFQKPNQSQQENLDEEIFQIFYSNIDKITLENGKNYDLNQKTKTRLIELTKKCLNDNFQQFQMLYQKKLGIDIQNISDIVRNHNKYIQICFQCQKEFENYPQSLCHQCNQQFCRNCLTNVHNHISLKKSITENQKRLFNPAEDLDYEDQNNTLSIQQFTNQSDRRYSWLTKNSDQSLSNIIPKAVPRGSTQPLSQFVYPQMTQAVKKHKTFFQKVVQQADSSLSMVQSCIKKKESFSEILKSQGGYKKIYKAEILKQEVNKRNGEVYKPNEEIQYIFELRNNGNEHWPDNTQLKCIEDNSLFIDLRSLSLPSRTQKKFRHSSLVPRQEGVVIQNWRLCYEDDLQEDENDEEQQLQSGQKKLRYFGPRMKITYEVKKDNEESNQKQRQEQK